MTVIERAALLALAIALIGAAGGCSEPLAPEWDALQQAEQRWREAGPERYEYVYTPVCYCGLAPRRVVVEDGVVVQVEPITDPDDPLPGPPPLEGYTVEALLDRVRAGLERPPHDARLEFDPSLGYPRDVWFDPEEHAIDEEWGFRVTELRLLP